MIRLPLLASRRMPLPAGLKRFLEPSLVALSLSTASMVPSLFAEDYAIIIDRPLQVSHRAQVSVKASDFQDRIMAVEGRDLPRKSSRLSASVEAVEEVLKVDEGGRVSSAKFALRSASFRDGDHVVEAYDAGTVIRAARVAGRTKFSLGDEEVDEARRPYLDLVLGLAGGEAKKSELEENRVFGSQTRRRVGESWEIDRKAFTQFYDSKFGPPYAYTVAKGEVTLEKVAEVGGVDCLFLRARVVIRIDQLKDFPGEAKFTENEVKMDYQMILPVNASLPRAGESFAIQSTMDLQGEVRGRSMSMRVVLDRSYEATFKTLKIES